jgi:hypothetical protein
MKNHITPEKVQYVLQYIDNESVIQNTDVTEDFAEWNSFATDIVRDDLTGAFIQIQDGGISFTRDSLDIVKSLFERDSFRAQAKLIVSVRKDTFPNLWTYEQKAVLDLNFATYVEDRSSITLTANENGLKALIKSGASQKYDIPVSELAPDTLVYDGLAIKETLTWFIGPLSGTPITINGQESINNTWTGRNLFCPSLYSSGQDINSNYNNYITQLDQPLSENNSGWKQWDDVEWVSGNTPALFTVSQSLEFNFTIKGVLNIKSVVPWSNMEFQLVGNKNNEKIKICDVVNANSTATFSASLGNTVTIPETNESDSYYLRFAMKTPNSEFPALIVFEFQTGGYIQVDWIALPKSSISMSVISEQKLCQKLIDYITSTTGIYTAVVDDHDETMRIATGESIRSFPTQYVHTSLSDFASYMKSAWGYEYDIDGNTIRFAHRDNFFQPVKSLAIPEINNWKFSVNETYIYTGVKIGISLVQYLSINGTDEFRFVEEWSTGVQNVINVLDLTSPYRTDSYGFQLLADKQYVTNTTDDQSDNSIFVVHVQRDGDNYKLNRVAMMTGVNSPETMFNAVLSPRQCLIRNASLLGISCKTLKFTSTLGNADITINGVSEKADITIDNSLFMANVLDCDIGDIVDLPTNKNGLVSCTLNGRVYNGFIKKLSHFWGENQKTGCQLFIYSIERDTSRDIDYDLNDYDSNDYKTR